MRLRLAADAVVLSEHHASQVPRFGGLNALVAEVQLLRRDLELLRSQMARPAPEETCAGGDPACWPAEPRSELLQPALGEDAVAN